MLLTCYVMASDPSPRFLSRRAAPFVKLVVQLDQQHSFFFYLLSSLWIACAVRKGSSWSYDKFAASVGGSFMMAGCSAGILE